MPSSRQTGYKYGGYGSPGYGIPAGGGRGGVGLLDILSGNTPSKLQSSSQQHEKEMEDIMAQHEINLEKIKSDLVLKLLDSTAVTQLATAQGIPKEEFVKRLVPLITQNAEKSQGLKGRQLDLANNAYDPQQNPNAQPTANAASGIAQYIAAGAKPPEMTGTVPQGQTGTFFTPPGLQPTIVKGSTSNVKQVPTKMMPDPAHPGQMIPFEYGTAISNIPGEVSVPIPPEVKQQPSINPQSPLPSGASTIDPNNPSAQPQLQQSAPIDPQAAFKSFQMDYSDNPVLQMIQQLMQRAQGGGQVNIDPMNLIRSAGVGQY